MKTQELNLLDGIPECTKCGLCCSDIFFRCYFRADETHNVHDKIQKILDNLTQIHGPVKKDKIERQGKMYIVTFFLPGPCKNLVVIEKGNGQTPMVLCNIYNRRPPHCIHYERGGEDCRHRVENNRRGCCSCTKTQLINEEDVV